MEIILQLSILSKKKIDHCTIIWNTCLKDKYTIILIGSKLDVAVGDPSKRKVSYEEGAQLAQQHNLFKFFETSAKDGTNINEAFETLTIKVLSEEYRRKFICDLFNGVQPNYVPSKEELLNFAEILVPLSTRKKKDVKEKEAKEKEEKCLVGWNLELC